MALRTPDYVVGPFRERDSIVLTAVIRDETGTPIPQLSLLSAKMSLYNEADPFDIINGRDDWDIKPNINSAGELTFSLDGDDMAIQDTDELTEKHRIMIEWTWNAGARRGSCEIQVLVRNVLKVPTA